MTSGIAGVAFILQYLTGYGFGLYYTVLNLPFYAAVARAASARRSRSRSFLAVGLTSLITEIQPHYLKIETLDPVWTRASRGRPARLSGCWPLPPPR